MKSSQKAHDKQSGSAHASADVGCRGNSGQGWWLPSSPPHSSQQQNGITVCLPYMKTLSPEAMSRMVNFAGWEGGDDLDLAEKVKGE
mmetsp:Transcript_106675/g.180098  ORF Transcript_106675/g.180098 Transcript_106675/m.180098 type:complete len:87 (-) Transcript_106675:782-1042(-)